MHSAIGGCTEVQRPLCDDELYFAHAVARSDLDPLALKTASELRFASHGEAVLPTVVMGKEHFKAMEEQLGQLSTRTNSSVARTCSSSFVEEDSYLHLVKELQGKDHSIEDLRRQVWQLSSDGRLRKEAAALCSATARSTEVMCSLEEATGREVSRLAAALDVIRTRTQQVRAQMGKTNEECQELQERLDALDAAKRRQGQDAVATWAKVFEARAEAQEKLQTARQREILEEHLAGFTPSSSSSARPSTSGTSSRAEAEIPDAAWERLRGELRLRQTAKRLLKQKCASLEAEVASREERLGRHDRRRTNASCPADHSTLAVSGMSTRSTDELVARIHADMSAEQKRHDDEMAQLRQEKLRLQEQCVRVSSTHIGVPLDNNGNARGLIGSCGAASGRDAEVFGELEHSMILHSIGASNETSHPSAFESFVIPACSRGEPIQNEVVHTFGNAGDNSRPSAFQSFVIPACSRGDGEDDRPGPGDGEDDEGDDDWL